MFSSIVFFLVALNPVELSSGDSIAVSCTPQMACPVCPPVVVCPNPEPVPVEIKGFTVLPVDDNTIKVSIASIPVGAAKIKITSISTVGREVGPKVGPNPEFVSSSPWPQNISGFHPGWQLDIQAIALDASGKELVKSQAITVKMAGDPTTVWPAPVSNPNPNPTPVPPVGTQGTLYDAKVLGVQGAINASKAGDTILFPAGTYNLSTMIVVPSGRMLYSKEGAILHGAAAYAINSLGQIKVIGLTFDSTGIKFDGNTDGSLIDNCTFKTVNSDALYSGAKMVNTKVTNNLFTNFQHFSFMTYGGYSGLVIANNEFINVMAGPHVDGQKGSGSILMEQNYFNQVGVGPFSELQGGASGAIIEDNWAENPKLVPNSGCSSQPNNCYALGHSVPLNFSTGIVVKHNVVLAPQAPDGTGVRFAFELGGSGTFEENYISIKNVCFADTDGSNPSTLLTVQNNHCEGTSRIVEVSFPNAGRKVVQSNNNATVDLKWLLDRGRPFRNKRF